MIKIFKFVAVLLCFLLLFVSCEDEKTPDSSNESNESNESSVSGQYTSETSGYVTFYEGADATTVAYYVPEIEDGWYHCAVSETKYSALPEGTAVALSANGKTVNLLVTDLCPSSENAKHTSNSNYFFDLEKSAFTFLAPESVGELQMTFKTIPYPTSKKISLQIKGGSNEYWLSFRFYNMRYPLKKVEFSQNGTDFSEIQKLDGNKNNWYMIPSGTHLLSGAHYFRLTDVYDHIVTTKYLGSFSAETSFSTGVNFDY